MGDRERIGSGPVVGHLTSATLLESGGMYRAGAEVALHADAEVALELGDDDEIVQQAAHLLRAVGERLRPGDLLITGSVVQTAVRPGDRVVADLGALGRVERDHRRGDVTAPGSEGR